MVGTHQPRTGEPHEDVGTLDGIRQGPLVGLHGEHRLVLVQILATAVDHPLAVEHHDVLGVGAAGNQQLHAGNGRRTGAEADDTGAVQRLAGDVQGIEHARGRNDGGAVLVVMEDRDAALLDQCLLDLEALGCLDVLEVDAPPGIGDARHGVDEGLRALGVDLDVHRVDAGEALEQHALALHHGLARQGPEVAEAQDGTAVGDHRHQVALAGVEVGVLRVVGDLANRLRHAGTVGQGQVPGAGGGLGELHRQLSGDGFRVIVQRRLLLRVSHAEGIR